MKAEGEIQEILSRGLTSVEIPMPPPVTIGDIQDVLGRLQRTLVVNSEEVATQMRQMLGDDFIFRVVVSRLCPRNSMYLLPPPASLLRKPRAQEKSPNPQPVRIAWDD